MTATDLVYTIQVDLLSPSVPKHASLHIADDRIDHD